MRLTRAHVNRLPETVDEALCGPVREFDVPENFHADEAARLVAEHDPEKGFWVFAAGSLIWNPRCPVAERRVARVDGVHRSFCYGPLRRMRGSIAVPGRMMSLDWGGSCEGVALRVEAGDLLASVERLLRQEPPLPTEWMVAETAEGPVRAIVFVARKEAWAYAPEPPEAELAEMFASAVGHTGNMADYLLNTVEHLEAAGIRDPHLWRLQEMAAERLERLPERSGEQGSVDRRP